MAQAGLEDTIRQEIISALQAKRGHDIIELDMRPVHSSVCDYMVICHADSSPHILALVDEVEERVGAATGEYPFRTSERANAEWVVMDYFSVMVHIFLAATREFYNLEGLWGDAPRKEYSDED